MNCRAAPCPFNLLFLETEVSAFFFVEKRLKKPQEILPAKNPCMKKLSQACCHITSAAISKITNPHRRNPAAQLSNYWGSLCPIESCAEVCLMTSKCSLPFLTRLHKMKPCMMTWRISAEPFLSYIIAL